MSSWTPYCPRTGREHGDALACGSCLAQRSRTSPPCSRDIEVIDLIDSPPLRPTAITVFASPESSPQTTRFSYYNRTDGAEQLRQVAIARTKPNKPGSTIPVFNLLIHFYLSKQHARSGIRKCDSLCQIAAKLYPRTIESFHDLIQIDLLPKLPDEYKKDGDQYTLAQTIRKSEPVYMAQDADKRQLLETFLSDWFRNKNGDLETIYVIVVRKEDAKSPTKAQKEVKKIKKELQKEVKSKSTLKIKTEPAVRKKRSFSVTSLELEPEEIPVIKKEKEEEEPESPLDLQSPTTLLFGEREDGVAYRTRKRHLLQPEDLECSAEFGPV